jgi:hypothetical protein
MHVLKSLALIINIIFFFFWEEGGEGERISINSI